MTERGSATIVAIALVSGLTLVAGGLVGVARLVAAQVQATAAADAAALAAAPLTFLPGDPRGEARDYASANGARLTACVCWSDTSFRSRVVTVTVAKEVVVPVFGSLVVKARAAAEFDPMDLLGG
ncbi:MAG TPA: Rv3654c family TadE-like protein [Acidimicrobiia bacterium]|nr:Rv3654c family TadE-like protein [Acidimicrobiia bacterium]